MNQLQTAWRRYWWIFVLVIVLGVWWGMRSRQNLMLNYGGGDGYFGYGTGGVAPVMVDRGAEIKQSAALGMPSPIIEQGISDSANRMVIEENTVSLLVTNVDETADKIQKVAEDKGGFLVSRNIERPEESATGSISIRVPADRRDEVLSELKGMAVRVVSESVFGDDVTAQYEDLEAKLEVLLKTKAKLEGLLDQASRVTEILEVQRELTNLQYQIDAIQGQKDYLAKAASFTRITAYLSTDELALPYAPDEAFRPRVIFKQAVRQLVRTGREILSGLIWIAVFSPIWIALLVILFLITKLYGKKKN